MKLYSKEELIEKLKEIQDMEWLPNARHGNSGGVGNTLEDLLGIEENNLPIPNAAEWELKCQRIKTSSLTTLFHIEPSPRAVKFVPKILLPLYGWKHKNIAGEMSFRQTLNAATYTDRGFKINLDYKSRKILVSFNKDMVSPRHSSWFNTVQKKVGLSELDPQPYWGFDDIHHIAATKLLNCFYVRADNKKEKKMEYFWFKEIFILQKFSIEGFLRALKEGVVFVDFDARTGHNHGTKFRLKQGELPKLYKKITKVN